MGNPFFRTKLNSRRFPNPLCLCGTQEIPVRRDILSTDTLYILPNYKQPTEYKSWRTFQQGVETVFLHTEMPKNFILVYRTALLQSAAVSNHCKSWQLALWALGDAQNAMHYVRSYTQGFSDIVPSSSADVTFALRWCFRGGSVYLVSFRFKAKEILERFGDVFFDILITRKRASALGMC